MPHHTLQSKLTGEPSMKKSKPSSAKKRLGKFLSKIFWHFNQSVPDYSSVAVRARKKRREEEEGEEDGQQQQEQFNAMLYPKRYRTRHRTSTLMSIQEENEVESEAL